VDAKKFRLSGIKSWPADDRPREKLLARGPQNLSNSELLAILLREGAAGSSAMDLARALLAKFGGFRGMIQADSRDWQGIKGIGPAKTAQVRAALEIGRRYREEETKSSKHKISSAADVFAMMSPQLRDLKTEEFKVLYLDGDNRVIAVETAANGTVNQAFPIVREIMHSALQKYAAALIGVHNHPGAGITPSPQDRRFTTELWAAGRLLEIRVLDHLIIGDGEYFSFADSGLLAADE